MRYLKLLAIFYKNSIFQELKYRVNFLSNAFMSVFWLAWGIIGISIFFLYRNTMGD